MPHDHVTINRVNLKNTGEKIIAFFFKVNLLVTYLIFLASITRFYKGGY